jgi:hypothetical protein
VLYFPVVFLHPQQQEACNGQQRLERRTVSTALTPIDVLPEIDAKLNSARLHYLQERRERLLALLDVAIAPGRIVQALAGVGITAEDLAIALAANPRTTAAWLTGPAAEIRKKSHKERIRELKEVTRFVIDTGTIAEQEADWLRDPNRSADFRSPLELIREGDWKEAGRLYCDDVSIEVPPQFQGERRSLTITS